MNIVNFEEIKRECETASSNVKILNKSLSDVDKLIDVTMHELENDERMSACDGFHYSKSLQSAQKKRRIIKEQMDEQKIIRDKLKPFVDSYITTKQNIENARLGGKKKYTKNFTDINIKLNKIKIL